MVAETFQNFATSAVAGANMTTSSTTFNVTGGSGSSFPSSNFLVTIDTEIILVASRSTDTLTVASGGRGYDGSTAATHSIGATVQLCADAYSFNHLWQNVPDNYKPDVPPQQSSLSSAGVPNGSASSYDSEFESQGSWTFYPTVSGGSSVSFGGQLRSHLTFYRNGGDATLYTLYQSFSSGGSFMATMKLSEGINYILNGSSTSEVHFFFSDSSNPTAGADTGNRFRIDVITAPSVTSGVMSATSSRIVRCLTDVSGSSSFRSDKLSLPWNTPIYLRIVSDGSGNWRAYVGDGYCYWYLSLVQSFSFTPLSFGVQFFCGSNTSISQWAAIDFIRFTLGGSPNLTFGS